MFEIQTFTLCDGFVNTWTDDNENPILFDTKKEAIQALNEYLVELREAASQGLLSDYNVSDFRVSKV